MLAGVAARGVTGLQCAHWAPSNRSDASSDSLAPPSCRTREWNTPEERSRLADLCDARGGKHCPRLAHALRTKRSSGLTKGQMLVAARAWGYASSLWYRHGRASRRAADPHPLPGGLSEPLPPPSDAAAAATSGGGDEAAAGAGAAAAGACAPTGGPSSRHPDAAAMRLLGGGYVWSSTPAGSAPGAGGGVGDPLSPNTAALATAPPSALRAAARAEAAAVLQPLARAAVTMLRGEAGRAHAASCAYFGPADLSQVRAAASFFETAADSWLRLAREAESAAVAAEAAAAATGCAPEAGAAAAGAAATAPPAPPPPTPDTAVDAPSTASGGAASAPPPLPAPTPAIEVEAWLRDLTASVRRLATNNCARAFHLHPAVRGAAAPLFRHASRRADNAPLTRR